MFSEELDAFLPLEKYYSVKGIRTRCFEAGTGPAVILLHGGGGHAETWVRNVQPLAKYFHVYAIDYLGHGYTDIAKGMSRRLEDFRTHLLDFMDTVGVEKAHLVGESLGGQISVFVADEHPERVDKLAPHRGRNPIFGTRVHRRQHGIPGVDPQGGGQPQP